MFRLLLVLFSVVIFALLALKVAIHADQLQWQYGAWSTFAFSFIVDSLVDTVQTRTRKAPPAA